MLRKDYIQRQFEAFGKVLAALLSRKKNQDWDAFEKEMNEAVQKFTGLELDSLEAMSLENFVNTIASSRLEFDQKKILANLLFEKMISYQERSETKKYATLKPLCLFLYEDLTNDLTQNEFDLEAHYRLQLLRKHD